LTLDKGEAVVFLTRLGTTEFILEFRLWKSCLVRYLSLEERRLLVPWFAPESGIDEEHSPKPPRIRGYTDQGSKRPADKWLPPPPPVEDEDPNPNEKISARDRGTLETTEGVTMRVKDLMTSLAGVTLW